MMNPKVKKYLLHFILFGVIMALIWWAADVSEGKGCDLVKFLTRILIFGGIYALMLAILGPFLEKKKNIKNNE